MIGSPYRYVSSEERDKPPRRCFTFEDPSTGERDDLCVETGDPDDEDYNTDCEYLFGDFVCLDEFGNQITCRVPESDFEDCLDRKNVPEIHQKRIKRGRT